MVTKATQIRTARVAEQTKKRVKQDLINLAAYGVSRRDLYKMVEDACRFAEANIDS